jgi:ketosteroid isomerase-like protein
VKPTFLLTVPVFLVACFLGPVRAQTHDRKDEIPIERCDRLPVVTMKVAGQNRRFLLDTAAVTFLNRNSFASGEPGQLHIYSWSGGAAADAREVFLPQVELGTHKLRDLKLPAIDLSAIGKACGGQIDGILGVDLLDHMGMTIDLKRGVAAFSPVPEPGDSGDALAAAERDLKPCVVAFNHGDAKAMAECFDPEIVFYTQHGEYQGREEVMHYLSHRFFEDAPRLHYEATPHDVRLLGDVLWYSYDFRIDTPEEHLAGHGMTMCRKDAGGRWRMLSVDNSLKKAVGAPDRVH